MENFLPQEPQRRIDKVLNALKRDYIIIGNGHIKAWHAWLVLGLVVGVAAGVILVANRSGKLERSRAAVSGGVAQCSGNWTLDILDDPTLMQNSATKQWEPSIALSDAGDIAVIWIGGGLWIKPAGGAWQKEIDVATCDFDEACKQKTKTCGGDPIISWDDATQRFIAVAKCADNPGLKDLNKELGMGAVEKDTSGQWQWKGWKSAAQIGYDWANLAVGLQKEYWITGLTTKLPPLQKLESAVFYSPDGGLTWKKSPILQGGVMPGFISPGLHEVAGTLNGTNFQDISQALQKKLATVPISFFTLVADPASQEVRVTNFKENVVEEKMFWGGAFLGGLANCISGECKGKTIPNTSRNAARHGMIVDNVIGGRRAYRFIYNRDDNRSDGKVWGIGLWEAFSLDGGATWSSQKIDGGLVGDPNDLHAWKDAHTGGLVSDPMTGKHHLFYHYRDGADTKDEFIYYRTMDAGNTNWNSTCAIPQNSAPFTKDVTISGTGRDYADLSATNGKVGIVFELAPRSCKVGSSGCPPSVLGILRNF